MTDAVAYVRVSSRGQDDAMQRTAITRAAAARGDGEPEWYAERRSARTMQRLMLQELLRAARAGELRGRRLYVFRLDRLTRSGIADTLAALEVFRAGGVQVVSVADGFDVEGPHAEIIVAVMAWAAKMERLAINERIAAARDRVEAEGGHWGRRSRVDRETVAKATLLLDAGKTQREVSQALHIPRTTLRRALRNLGQKPGPSAAADRPEDPAP